MEENEKKSFWTRFKNLVKKFLPGKKAVVTLGLAASAMGANMEKANASDYIVERTDNKTITDVNKEATINPVDLSNMTVDARDLQKQIDNRSDLEKAASTIKDTQSGLNNVTNFLGSLSDLGNSHDISSVLNNAQRVANNADKAEKAVSQLLNKSKTNETKKEEVKKQEVSKETVKSNDLVVEKADKLKDVKESKKETVSQNKKEQTVSSDDKIASTSFDHIKFNPYDEEDQLSNQIVDLRVKASQAKYNGDMKLYNELTALADKMQAKRIEMTEARINEGKIPDVVENSPEYLAREYTPERLEKITAFTNLSPEWTPGEKLAVLADGLTDLKLAISDCKKNGDQHAVEKLVKVYNDTLKQRYALSQEALEHPEDPKFDLHMPQTYYKNIKSNHTQIDESKLADVSVGQMGTFETLDDDKKTDRVSIDNVGNISESTLSSKLAEFKAKKENKTETQKPSTETKVYTSTHEKATEKMSQKEERTVSIDNIGNINESTLSSKLAEFKAKNQANASKHSWDLTPEQKINVEQTNKAMMSDEKLFNALKNASGTNVKDANLIKGLQDFRHKSLKEKASGKANTNKIKFDNNSDQYVIRDEDR